MGWLSNLAESLTPAGRARAEDRRARAMLEEHARKLTAEVESLKESVTMGDVRLMGMWDQFQGLGSLLYPSGFPGDRKAGRDWPVLKDEQDLRQYRGFSRLLCETNSYAIGFRDHVRNYVVGSGFQWVVSLRGQSPGADSLDGDPDPDVTACQQVLDEFRRINCWGDDAEARADQTLDDAVTVTFNREREGYERAVEDGEYGLRLFKGDDSTRGVPTCREIEPEAVTTPPGHDITSAWGWGVKSVEVTDRHGRTHVDAQRQEAYHIADPDRPGEWGEVVPASHVVWLKLNAKGSVKRGVPDFFPIEDELKGSKTLTRNMLQVSGMLAAIAYIREHAPSTTADQVRAMLPQTAQQTPIPANRPPLPGQAGPDQTRLLTVHQAGLIIDVSNQLKYTPGPVNSGVDGFLKSQQAALRAAGMRWGCPEYFSGDASNANFASTLVAGGPFERATTVRQGEYKLFQCQLAVRVLLFAVASGRLTAEQVARVAVGVTVPPVAIADRTGDTTRRKTLADAKVLDPITWCREEGYDPAQVAANWKAWEKLFPPQGGVGGLPGGGGGGGGGLPPIAPPGSDFGGSGPFGVQESRDRTPDREPAVPDWWGDEPDADPDGEPAWPDDDEAPLDEPDPDLTESTGYSGERKDKRGRRMCYQDGKRVRCAPQPDAGNKPHPSARFQDNADHPPYQGTGEAWDRPTWQPAGKTRDGKLRWMHGESGRVATGDRPAEPSPQRKQAAHAERERRLSQPPTAAVAWWGSDESKAKAAESAAVAFGDRGARGLLSLLRPPYGTVISAHGGWADNTMSVSLAHPDVDQWSRSVAVNSDGTLSVSNNLFFLKPGARGSGMGTKAFAGQVQGMVYEGGRNIHTTAGKGGSGGDKMNGYYTWARLGYDAPLDENYRKRLPEQFKDARTVQDLMASREGAAHWKNTGYMTGMDFDTRPGSRSIQVLNRYLASKGEPPIEDDQRAVQVRERSIAERRERVANQPATPPPPPPRPVLTPPPASPQPATDPGEAEERSVLWRSSLATPAGQSAESVGRDVARSAGLDADKVSAAVASTHLPLGNPDPAWAVGVGWVRALNAAGLSTSDYMRLREQVTGRPFRGHGGQ